MASSFSAVQELEKDAKALQIVCLDFQDNRVVVDEENMKIINENLKLTGADAVSIVAIMGTYRTGKSFLLDLLLRYLRRWESSVATETRKTELKATAFKKAEFAAKIHDGKSEEEARAAGHRAALEAVKDIKDVTFPLPKNERWTMKGPTFPPPAWAHCCAAAATADNGLERESAGLADGGSGFEWRGGMEKCTEGIWLWSRPFILPFEGRNVAVLLMDTQGAWDAQMTKEQCATIFGLSALMASKFICNVQNMLTDDKIDAIDYFTTFAQAACSGLTSDEAPFGHLEFLIRDWPWYEKGMAYDQCKEMAMKHLDKMLNSNVQGRKETAERLKEIFRRVSCFGLPHPGLGVLEPSFQGEFSEIGSDFFQLLDEFARQFFDPASFPRPSAPLGTEVTPSTFENVIKNFVEGFSVNNGSAVQLREAFVKVEVFKNRDLLLESFKNKLKQVAPESRPIDPDAFEDVGSKIMADFLRDFENKIRSFKMPDETQQISEFREAIGQMLTRRQTENSAELDGAQMKLVASPAVGCGLYFMTGHPVIDCCIVGLVGWMQAKKRMAELKKDSFDLEVVTALSSDVQRFAQQRMRDVQAMMIAAQRCSPNVAMEQVMSRANVAVGAMATAASAASAANGAASNNNVNKKLPA